MPFIDIQSIGCECQEGYLYHNLFISTEGHRLASNPSTSRLNRSPGGNY